MKINLVAYGIAKDILKGSSLNLSFDSAVNVGQVKDKLIENYPEFEKLRSLKFAVNEDYQADDFQLKENDEVVIIPPVSGG